MFRQTTMTLVGVLALAGPVLADPVRPARPAQSGGPGFMREAGVVTDPRVARELANAFGMSNRPTNPAPQQPSRTAQSTEAERWRQSLNQPVVPREVGPPRTDTLTGGSRQRLPANPVLPSSVPTNPGIASVARPGMSPADAMPWNHQLLGDAVRYSTAFERSDADRVLDDLRRSGHGPIGVVPRSWTYFDANGRQQTKTVYDIYYRPMR